MSDLVALQRKHQPRVPSSERDKRGSSQLPSLVDCIFICEAVLKGNGKEVNY